MVALFDRCKTGVKITKMLLQATANITLFGIVKTSCHSQNIALARRRLSDKMSNIPFVNFTITCNSMNLKDTYFYYFTIARCSVERPLLFKQFFASRLYCLSFYLQCLPYESSECV